MSSLPIDNTEIASESRANVRPPVLECDRVSFAWRQGEGDDTPTLLDVDFQVFHGEFVGILGPSGCGKTTLLRLLSGLAVPDCGTVRFDGQVLGSPRREIGVVFQDYALFPWLNVIQNVAFGLRMSGIGRTARLGRSRALLASVGMDEVADRYPHQLSGGMRQRVAIARVLANDPECILMDEPFGALDAQTRYKMQRFLLDVWRRYQSTIVFVTHDIEEAILLSDRIYVLAPDPGRVVSKEVIDIPRPRDRSSTSTVQLRTRLLGMLEVDDANDHLPNGSPVRLN